MVLIFIALLIAVPLAELWVIFTVAHQFGALETILALIAISMVGGWIVRRVGLGVLARGLGQAAEGRVPADELINGGIVLVAGALMFTPGFLTDAVGLALLAPPVRAVVRKVARKRFQTRVASPLASRFSSRFGSVINTDGHLQRRPSRQTELE